MDRESLFEIRPRGLQHTEGRISSLRDHGVLGDEQRIAPGYRLSDGIIRGRQARERRDECSGDSGGQKAAPVKGRQHWRGTLATREDATRSITNGDEAVFRRNANGLRIMEDLCLLDAILDDRIGLFDDEVGEVGCVEGNEG